MNSREEVAWKLRRIEEDVDYETAFMEIDTIIGTKDNYSFSFFFNRLANLIDPTCTADIKRKNDGIDAQPYYTSSCGNCGALWDTITGAALLPKYCPNCGARVVRDES